MMRSTGYFLVVALSLFAASSSHAQCTHNWTNAAGGDFEVGANWDVGFSPGPSDHACITLDAAYTVELNGVDSVDVLTLGADGNTNNQVLELGTSDSLKIASLSQIARSGVLELNRGAVFPSDTLVNGGLITVTGTTPGIIKGGIVRNDSLILLDGPPGGNLRLADDGGVDNYGVIELHNARDILFISNTDAPDTLRNQVGGEIVAIGDDAGDRADITAPMRNQGGEIRSEVGLLRIHNDQIIDSGILEADAGATIEFYDGTKIFTGLMTGSPDGDVKVASSADVVFQDTATFHMSGTGFELASWDGTGGVVHNLGFIRVTGFSGSTTVDGITFLNDSVFAMVQGEDLEFTNGARFENFATLRFEGNTPNFDDGGSPDSLINHSTGVIQRINGLTSEIHLPFVNYGGSIEVDAGSWFRFFEDTIIEDGSYSVGAGGRIAFVGAASHLFSGFFDGSGDGTFDFGSGTFSIPDSVTFHFPGGGAQAQGTTTWTGGGLVRNTGVFNHDGNFTNFMFIDSLTFVNDSLFSYIDGRIRLMDQGRFENDGELRVVGGLVFDNAEPTADSLVNMPNGSIVQTDAEISLFEVNFVNYGEIRLNDAATMRIWGPSEFRGGTYAAATGGTILIGDDDQTIPFSGLHGGFIEGVVELQADSIIIADSATFHFSGAGIDWIESVLSGPGLLRNKGAFWFNNSVNLTIDGLEFANDSLFSWKQNRDIVFVDGAFMNNSGLIDLPLSGIDFVAGTDADTLENAVGGEIRRPFGNTTFSVDVINSGILNAEAGTFFFTGYVENTPGGIFAGAGTINVTNADDFVNNGDVSPGTSPGILSFFTNFEMATATSNLVVDLEGTTAGTEYDQLSVSGTAEVGGDIDVTLGFIPSVGNTFQILTASSVSSCEFPDTVFVSSLPYSAAFEVNCNASDVTLEVVEVDSTVVFTGKAFLEGPFGAGTMSVDPIFEAAVPLSQPFSDALYDGSPLEHDSLESVSALPLEAVDWVQLSLRTGTDHTTEVPGSRRPAILLSDGSIVGLGSDTTFFGDVGAGSYHVVVRGRNHMAAMSATPIDFSDGVGEWDFTTGLSQAFGTTPMKELPGGVFGLFASDADFDGQSIANDFNLWLADTKVGATGYVQTDFNFDGQVTATDFNIWLLNTKSGAASEVPD